mgnify:FL=1
MILPVLGVIIAHVLSIWTLEYSSPQIDALRDYGFDKKTTIIVLLYSVPASATFDFLLWRGRRQSRFQADAD